MPPRALSLDTHTVSPCEQFLYYILKKRKIDKNICIVFVEHDAAVIYTAVHNTRKRYYQVQAGETDDSFSYDYGRRGKIYRNVPIDIFPHSTWKSGVSGDVLFSHERMYALTNRRFSKRIENRNTLTRVRGSDRSEGVFFILLLRFLLRRLRECSE